MKSVHNLQTGLKTIDNETQAILFGNNQERIVLIRIHEGNQPFLDSVFTVMVFPTLLRLEGDLLYDDTINVGRITIQTAGYYHITLRVYFENSSKNNSFSGAWIKVNDNEERYFENAILTNDKFRKTTSGVLYLNKNDYIEPIFVADINGVLGNTFSGSNPLSAQPYIAMIKIG
jgi:hypothetical protein